MSDYAHDPLDQDAVLRLVTMSRRSLERGDAELALQHLRFIENELQIDGAMAMRSMLGNYLGNSYISQ